MTLKVRWQRQGVSPTLRAWFLSCAHGHAWHLEAQWDYRYRFYHVNLSYPNCHECFGPKEEKPEWDGESTWSYSVWESRMHEWNMKIRSGQIAWSSWKETFSLPIIRPESRLACEKLAEMAIEKILGFKAEFLPHVEAYCCSSAADLGRYSYLIVPQGVL